MAMRKGEMYHCEHCGCEIAVTRGPEEGKGGSAPPRCCCGMEMVKS
jgi:hypothetical protein